MNVLGFWESHFILFFEGFIPLATYGVHLSHLDSNSYSNNEELLEEITIDDWIVVQPIIIGVNTREYFTSAKLDEESKQSVNHDAGLGDILATMQATLSLFKFLTKI